MNPVQKTILAFIAVNVAVIAGLMIYFIYDVVSSIVRWRRTREEANDGNYGCIQCGRQSTDQVLDDVFDDESCGEV